LLAISVLLFIAGGAASVWGWNEQKLADKSTAEAVNLDLAKIEAGEKVDNFHVRIGPHYACYYATVYSERQEKTAGKVVSSSLTHAYYPIVSISNADVKILEPLEKKYGDLNKVPPDEEIPQPNHFVVLVKTSRFKKLEEIPDAPFRREESVHGMIINEISSLAPKEKELIKQQFPTLNVDKLLVLEDGREPTSSGMRQMAMYGGMAGAILGLGLLVGTLLFGLKALLFTRH
jgi:hypothetical protein